MRPRREGEAGFLLFVVTCSAEDKLERAVVHFSTLHDI